MKKRKKKRSEVWVNHEVMERLKAWVLNRPTSSSFEPKTPRKTTNVYPDHPVFEEEDDTFAA